MRRGKSGPFRQATIRSALEFPQQCDLSCCRRGRGLGSTLRPRRHDSGHDAAAIFSDRRTLRVPMCYQMCSYAAVRGNSSYLQLPQRSQLANVIEHQRVLSKGVCQTWRRRTRRQNIRPNSLDRTGRTFRAEGLQAQHLRAKSVLGAACRTTQISSTCSVVLL